MEPEPQTSIIEDDIGSKQHFPVLQEKFFGNCGLFKLILHDTFDIKSNRVAALMIQIPLNINECDNI